MKQAQLEQNTMSDASSAPLMAIIMLGNPELPSNEALKQAISARLPGASFGAEEIPNLFVLDGALCMVGRVDAPAPISRQDSCFAATWYWPEAWNVIKNHKAHILVSVNGADAKTRAALLCQLVAAAIEASSSPLAVHSATSDVLLPAQTVPGMVPRGSGSIAPMLLVGVRLSRDTGRPGQPPTLSAFTAGLSAFDLMELETIGYTGKPGELNVTLLDIASYLLSAGPVLKDGDTVGPDEKTKITVRHEPSKLLPGRSVYRLYFNGPANKPT
jgi:Domain of unknown function (DUF4261)